MNTYSIRREQLGYDNGHLLDVQQNTCLSAACRMSEPQ